MTNAAKCSSMLQSFISSLTKKRYSPRARADRGMPLADGRNTAASNIGNIGRQTLFDAVRWLDNSRRKYRGNGEDLIKKYLQSAVITQWTRRKRARERKRSGRKGAREILSSLPASFLARSLPLFLRFFLFRIFPSTDSPCRPRVQVDTAEK